MKIASVVFENETVVAVSNGDQDEWGILDSQQHPGIRSVKSLIEKWADLKNGIQLKDFVEAKQLRFLCPITAPEKIICVGKNYVDHARELGSEPPEIPVIFNKLPSCLIGSGDDILLPPISNKVDFEAELVVVIGKPGRYIRRENAMEHVFGYTIGNDVTARDWQKGRPGGQWLLGKTFDTFGPLGPHIVLENAVSDPNALDVELKLNGQVMQNGNTADLIFSIDYLIEHVSKFFTLKGGDLLFTGTPAGVGAGRDPEVYLAVGDRVEITISEIGTLENSVAQ